MPHLVAWGKILFVVFISLISLLSTIGKLLSLLKLDVCFALIHSTAPVPSAVIILVLTLYTTLLDRLVVEVIRRGWHTCFRGSSPFWRAKKQFCADRGLDRTLAKKGRA